VGAEFPLEVPQVSSDATAIRTFRRSTQCHVVLVAEDLGPEFLGLAGGKRWWVIENRSSEKKVAECSCRNSSMNCSDAVRSRRRRARKTRSSEQRRFGHQLVSGNGRCRHGTGFF